MTTNTPEHESKMLQTDYTESDISNEANSSVTFKDGTVLERAKWYDPDADEIITDAMTKDLTEAMARKEGYDSKREAYIEILKNKSFMELNARDMSINFCKYAHTIPQFHAKGAWFTNRGQLIEQAHVYKLKEDLVQLFIEKNTNDDSFRYMPRDNMFLECHLEYDGVVVAGIHLVRVYVETASGKFQLPVWEYEETPVGYEEAISIFVHGVDKDGATYYNYFSLNKLKEDIYQESKDYTDFACPHCNAPLFKRDRTILYCENDDCITAIQNGVRQVYDLRKGNTFEQLKVMHIDDIWKIEAPLRNFVTNFLDFITNPEVIIYDLHDKQSLDKKNEKRRRKGQSFYPPVHVIDVDGYVRRYINGLKSEGETYESLKTETWVRGSFMRFWRKDRYTRLYANLMGCTTDEEKVERLKQVPRELNGVQVPDAMKYQWDSVYQVIKVWKMPFVKNKDGELDTRLHVSVVKQ